jgi:hypothetical protein
MDGEFVSTASAVCDDVRFISHDAKTGVFTFEDAFGVSIYAVTEASTPLSQRKTLPERSRGII